MRAARPPLDPVRLDPAGSFAWIADPDEPHERASCALVVPAGLLVVDPVDAPGLDEALGSLGRVAGVVTLLDRHQRDAEAVAARLGAPRLLPAALGGPGVGVPGVEERSVLRRPGWREALLWLPDRRLLVCAETLGTNRFFLARDGDRLGLHPLARILPPVRAFSGLRPDVVAVGHGPPLLEGAEPALRHALAHASRDLPRAWLRAARLARQLRR